MGSKLSAAELGTEFLHVVRDPRAAIHGMSERWQSSGNKLEQAMAKDCSDMASRLVEDTFHNSHKLKYRLRSSVFQERRSVCGPKILQGYESVSPGGEGAVGMSQRYWTGTSRRIEDGRLHIEDRWRPARNQ